MTWDVSPRWLRTEGLKVLRAMQAGAKLEPGLLSIEVVEEEVGGAVVIRLLVDGRPGR